MSCRYWSLSRPNWPCRPEGASNRGPTSWACHCLCLPSKLMLDLALWYDVQRQQLGTNEAQHCSLWWLYEYAAFWKRFHCTLLRSRCHSPNRSHFPPKTPRNSRPGCGCCGCPLLPAAADTEDGCWIGYHRFEWTGNSDPPSGGTGRHSWDAGSATC